MFAVLLANGPWRNRAPMAASHFAQVMRQFPAMSGSVSYDRSDCLALQLAGTGEPHAAMRTDQEFPISWLCFAGVEPESQIALAEDLARGAFEILSDLTGDFSLAWIDARSGALNLVRDPVATRPLYYRADSGIVAAASTAAALKFPGLPLTADPEWIARYSWMTLSEDFERTAYREIRKLPPGHRLEISPGKQPIVSRWHSWRQGAELEGGDTDSWVERYRHMLVDAVACRLGPGRPLAFEASGGLDSSSVAAAALKSGCITAGELHAFGYGLCEQEPEAIARVVDHLGLQSSKIYQFPDAVSIDQVDRTLAAIGYPEENSTASSFGRLLGDAAACGAVRLLSGYGGDEVVTNPGFQARHDFLAARRYSRLFGSFAGGPARRSVALAHFLAIGRRGKVAGDLKAEWMRRWDFNLLTDEAAKTFGIEQDHRQSLDRAEDNRSLSTMIVDRHLNSPSMTTRFENCFLVGQTYGIEYVWPLCDSRLIEFYLAAPAIERLGPGPTGRYLHRRAVAAWLPEEIAWRPGKYMGPTSNLSLASGLPVSDWATSDLASPLQGMIDPARVEKARALLEAAEGPSGQVLAARASLARLAWLNRWLRS